MHKLPTSQTPDDYGQWKLDRSRTGTNVAAQDVADLFAFLSRSLCAMRTLKPISALAADFAEDELDNIDYPTIQEKGEREPVRTRTASAAGRDELRIY